MTSDRTERVYEQLLVLRCQTGSEEAFAELVRRYAPRLRYYLRRMIGRAEDAEDALQEVWTDIYRGLARLETAAAFVPWIYRIARSRALRHWRRKRVPCVPLVEDEVPQCGAEPVFGSDEAQEMIAALDRISAEHREALLLHYIEGMTAEQISQVTGCPAGTVRSRLHYAKRSLRREMEQRCNDEPI